MCDAAFTAALEQARQGAGEGGVPIGAALARGGRVVAAGRNRRVQDGDPTAHAEIDCLRAAGRLGHYADTILYTTLAPCDLCTGAILLFGIPRVVVGEERTFPGGVAQLRGRGVEVTVLDDSRPRALMAAFAAARPELWLEDIGSLPAP